MKVHLVVFVAVLLAAVGANGETARAGGIKAGEYTASFKATRAAEGMDCDAWSSKGTFKFSVQTVDGAMLLVPRENFPASDAIVVTKQGSTLTGVIAAAGDDLTPPTVINLAFKGKKVTGRISSDGQCAAQVTFSGKWKKKPLKYAAKVERDIAYVAITIQGAVVGPVDQNGAAWDGPGFSNTELTYFSEFVVAQFPVGEIPMFGEKVKGFAVDLVASIVTAFDAPDPKGTATVFVDGTAAGTVQLTKAQDNFAPTWDVVLPDVFLRGASLVVTLIDTDLVEDDPMATVTVSEEVLRQAAGSGGTFSIDASGPSGEMIQRLFITVAEVPPP